MNGILVLLQRLGIARVAALAAVAIGLLAFFGYFANKLAQPPMGLLYGDLSTSDSGQIVSKLEAQAIPYELRAGGTLSSRSRCVISESARATPGTAIEMLRPCGQQEAAARVAAGRGRKAIDRHARSNIGPTPIQV